MSDQIIFRNMFALLTTIWEIVIESGTACVMQDYVAPEFVGKEYKYSEMIQCVRDKLVHAEDQKIFDQYTNPESVSKLVHEEHFEFRTMNRSGNIRHFKGILTPFFNEKGILERVYFSTIDLDSDGGSLTNEIYVNDIGTGRWKSVNFRKRLAATSLVLVVLFIAVACVFAVGINKIKPAFSEVHPGNIHQVIVGMFFMEIGVMTIVLGIVAIVHRNKMERNDRIRSALLKAANAMNNAAEVERSANEAKTRFFSSISHDIRTPMNAIMGMSTLAANRINDKEYVAECLEKIQVAGNQLLTLINNVLDISKIESGHMTLNPVDFSVLDLAGRITDIIRMQAVSKKQLFNVNIHDIREEYLVGDDVRINQIYSNLLSNAVKYTPAGGEIKMEIYESVDSDMAGCDAVDTAGAKKIKLVFVVEDNGIGIPAEFRENMYGAFTRGNNREICKIAGTGLGLSICKELVDLMNGEIVCKSEENKGTCFVVSLILEKGNRKCKLNEGMSYEGMSYEGMPYEGMSEADLRVGRTENGAYGKHGAHGEIGTYGEHGFDGMRVLVAEDNDLNWEIMEELLGMYGIDAERAENGSRAVAMVNNMTPGYYKVVLMDMQMPVMDGREATRIIRQSESEEVRKIPIFAMTADVFTEDVANCLDSGMNGHIPKPVDIKKLLSVLAQYT